MDKDYGKIIAQNLKRIAYENDRTQADICRDLKLSDSTVSSWFNGSRIPRMSKIDLLTHYFNCTRADIMEPYKPAYLNVDKDTLDRAINRVIAEKFEKQVGNIDFDFWDLMDKYTRLTREDREEIMAMIDLKLSRYKEKEKQDLA